MLRADDAADDAIEIEEISVNNNYIFYYATEDCSMNCRLYFAVYVCSIRIALIKLY